MTATTTIDASGRQWPVDGARLVRAWNVGSVCGRNASNHKAELRRTMRHMMCQNVYDYRPRGIVRNRCGAHNRRWRKYEAQRPRVLWSCAAFEIVA